MRVFILAVDALEHDFVDCGAYPALKQTQYCRVHIPLECMTILDGGTVTPFTPVVWQTIFTGKSPQTKPSPKSVKPQWDGREEDMFLNLVHKPILVHNPLMSDVKWTMKGVRNGFDLGEIVESALETFGRERSETFAKLGEDWDLFVTYTKLLDTVGHLYWQRDDIIEEYYHMVDSFAQDIRSKLGDDASFIVISDHGMKPLKGTKHQGGMHSNHAFASFSHRIDVPQPFKITDVYPTVANLLEVEDIGD